MKYLKIDGLTDVYPEQVEGTSEWYYCKLAKNTFCDLYEAEDIIKSGNIYQGMNCVLIHYPDGEVIRPFEIKENMYVDVPVFYDGILYFLVVDFNQKQIQIISYNPNTRKKSTVTEIPLSEVEDCYNLLLRVAPVLLIREANDGYLNVIWPEKKKIKIGDTEGLMFCDGDNLYCSEWYEDTEYHEMIIIRDWNTGQVKEKFEGQMIRMPNGDIWIL